MTASGVAPAAWQAHHDLAAGFQVVLVRPDGYQHSGAFSEVIESVACGLRALGAQVSVEVNRLVRPGPQVIMFGANLLEPHEAPLLEPSTIVYNLEQISESSAWCTPTYLQVLRTCQVWDYSARNIAALSRLGVRRTAHVPIGYVPELTRVPSQLTEDIDVLFYGSLNERRARVVADMEALGLKTKVVFGVYGAARDELIARSKVVLNLHYYDTSIFEIVRVSYLLANRKAVVAECHAGTEVDPDMVDAVRFAPYEELARTCAELVADPHSRRLLADRGFNRISARDQRAYLAQALGVAAQVSGLPA